MDPAVKPSNNGGLPASAQGGAPSASFKRDTGTIAVPSAGGSGESAVRPAENHAFFRHHRFTL